MPLKCPLPSLRDRTILPGSNHRHPFRAFVWWRICAAFVAVAACVNGAIPLLPNPEQQPTSASATAVAQAPLEPLIDVLARAAATADSQRQSHADWSPRVLSLAMASMARQFLSASCSCARAIGRPSTSTFDRVLYKCAGLRRSHAGSFTGAVLCVPETRRDATNAVEIHT
jgi:hypothetical protein